MFSPKKLLLATALAAATLSAAGTTWAKDLTIGLAVANLQADFFNQIKQSVEAEGKAKGIKVITVDAQGNSSTQVSQIEDLITRQIDVLIYIPAGATAAGVPVKAAKAAGIPVIAVDRNAPDAPGDTFIASDSVAGAKTLAEYVGKITDGKGRIAILQGQLGTTPENDRAKGFEEGLKAFPDLKVVAQQPAEWAQDKGFAVAQDLLQRDPNITVFFGRADAMALGAAQAVKVGNLDHKVVVVGFDGDVAGLKGVQSGVVIASLTHHSHYFGRVVVDSAIDLKAGKDVPKEQLLPTVLTTKDNVAPFLQQHP